MKRALLVFLISSCFSSIALAASAEISSAEFKDRWPLTVNTGTLTCNQGPGNLNTQLVTFTTGRKTYALNGAARGQAKRRGWLEIDQIWRDNPSIPGAKVSIRPLIDRGLALCN